MKSLFRKIAVGLLAGVALTTPALAGRVIVNHDEWTFSNTGASQAGGSNVATFLGNLAGFMNSNGGACNFLVYSNNFGFTQAPFSNGMTAAGCSLTFDTGAFDSGTATLANYDGVFLGGSAHSYVAAALIAYVDAGGSAYIAGGTGVGGSANEAARWNPFLQEYGLQFGSNYNGCCGNDTVEGTHPLLAGVDRLYYDNGNTVSLFGGNANAALIELNQQRGLLGVYDDVRNVPEPSTGLVLGIAVLGLGAVARRRQAA